MRNNRTWVDFVPVLPKCIYCVVATMATQMFPLAFSARTFISLGCVVQSFFHEIWSRSAEKNSEIQHILGIFLLLEEYEWKIVKLYRWNGPHEEERRWFPSATSQSQKDNYRGGIIEERLCRTWGCLKINEMHRK